MWCIKEITEWFARTQIYWQEFVNLSNAKMRGENDSKQSDEFQARKIRPDLFSMENQDCFPRLNYCDQEPLLLLNVTEDYFLAVYMRLYQLDTRFVLLQNHLAFPSKVT